MSGETKTAWIVARPDYDDYAVQGVFDSKEKAQVFLDELDLTPKGKRRGLYSLDAFPLNPVNVKAAKGFDPDA